MNDDQNKTGSTLFAVLANPNSDVAWERFVKRYAPIICVWCRRKGWAQDAEDITQEIFKRFTKQALNHNFTYDPGKSFKGWLKILFKHAIWDMSKTKYKYSNNGVGIPVKYQVISMISLRNWKRRKIARYSNSP